MILKKTIKTFIITLVLLMGVLKAPVGFARTKDSVPEINLDRNRLGRMYEGWGTVFSYAKLLYDYPEKERDDILDLLFLPNYGASLQILKVAIGYDGNSDESCWQANKRSVGDPGNYRRGYGGWLLDEARKRNPDIRLAALHWGYPAWADTDELKARFIYEYVKGVFDEYGHTIEYIGGNQNESKITPEVTKMLRKLLDEGGFDRVKIIAADEGARVKMYSVIHNMIKDPDYAKVIDIVGIHFKGRPGDTDILKNAFPFGKPIWSTEDGGGNYKSPLHGYSTIDQFMKLFHDARLTCAIRWLATSSHYENMPWPAAGIMKANEPWSGYYEIGAIVWGIAHLNQFIGTGWKMIETDDTYLHIPGTDTRLGRFAAYTNEKTGDYSIVLRTNKFESAEKIRINIRNLINKDLTVWESDFRKDENHWFVKKNKISSTANSFELEILPEKVYTITTTTGQQKGKTIIPPQRDFPFPYRDDFDSYKNEDLPRYFVNINSSFEVATENRKRVLKQVVKDAPLQWHYRSNPISQPLTILGDMKWKDYKVSVNAMLKDEGRLLLGGRFDGKMTSSADFDAEGYWLSLADTGSWQLLRKDAVNKEFVLLDSGNIVGFGLNKWVKMGLSFKGDKITAFINDKEITVRNDNVYPNGNIALALLDKEASTFFSQTKNYPIALFNDLIIE